MKQTLRPRPPMPTGSLTGESEEQLPLPRVLLLHLAPGMGIVLILWLITPWLINRGLPTELGFLLGVVFFSLPLELGYLLYLGKQRNGVFSLRGIVL